MAPCETQIKPVLAAKVGLDEKDVKAATKRAGLKPRVSPANPSASQASRAKTVDGAGDTDGEEGEGGSE